MISFGASDRSGPFDGCRGYTSPAGSDHCRLIPRSQQCSCNLCNSRSHEIHLPIDLFQPRFGSSRNINGAVGNRTKKNPHSNRCGVFTKILGDVGLIDHRYLHHCIGLTNHGAVAPLAQFDRIHNVHALGDLTDHCVLTV